MKSDQVLSVTATFEGHAQQTEDGVEYWLARDLQQLLGYTEWRNFLNIATKAKTACEVSGHQASDHFVDVNKMVDLGSGSQREIDDIMLNPNKKETSGPLNRERSRKGSRGQRSQTAFSRRVRQTIFLSLHMPLHT